MGSIIKVEDISKAYQLGDFGTGTISRDLERFFAKIRGKEDPFLKIGEVNDRSVKGSSDVVWSLKDISFEVEQGDAVGIIGRNGAGKSTLLKILSRVTSPTTGSIKVKGRIASLLEVGTGFHPELTGKENIYLNGAILGMRHAEIKRKFDEIVDFSGVERYIDTPVKRYSSGMYVRLAFAVAAHLESEILIVDEVLAVGDAEFQNKCLGKMGDISKGEGRTVLFVSHNMGAVSQLCHSGLVLKDGTINYLGQTSGALESYLSINSQLKQTGYDALDTTNKKVHISSLRFINNSRESNIFLFNEQINVLFHIANLNLQSSSITMTVIVKNNQCAPIFSTHRVLDNNTTKDDELKLTIPSETLLPGKYLIDIILHRPHIEFIEKIIDMLEFVVEDSGNANSIYENENLGDINIGVKWGN